MAEISGYHRLKRLLPKNTFFQRIETTAGAGVPDLYVCCRGRSSWIELKEARVLKDGRIQAKHVRPSQRAWALQATKAGANVFMFLKVGRYYYLLLPSTWSLLIEGLTESMLTALHLNVHDTL